MQQIYKVEKIKQKNKKMQNKKEQEIINFIVTPKQSNNLIFNYHKRGASSLSLPINAHKSKVNSRQHSIMLLRKSRKECNFKENQAEQKCNSSSIFQCGANNKVNFINFMSYNSQPPKVKSNYCKKITLTNVQKYYQSCLKKVKYINTAQCQQSPEEQIMKMIKSRPITPARKLISKQEFITSQPGTPQVKRSISYNNSPNTFSKSMSLRQKQQNNGLIQCSNYSRLLFAPGQSNTCINYSHHIRFKDQIPSRNTQSSSNYRKQKEQNNRKFINTSQKFRNVNNSRYKQKNVNKNQFVIDRWEAQEQPSDDIF